MELLRAFARTVDRLAPTLARWLPRLGALLLALAAAFAGQSWLRDRALLHATATVTENVAVLAPQGGVLYHPRLRFRTSAGQNVQALDTQGRDEPEFAAGTSLPAAWAAGDPQHAAIATVGRIYGAAIWLAVLGVVIFDVGWILRLRGGNKATEIA